ncbi:MAG: rRNA maturation RNase YbeY [Deltaproteobacteria bacterium]|nr:rRNA maturation RNase YbeY [Deltaproteobacteria bacterium]
MVNKIKRMIRKTTTSILRDLGFDLFYVSYVIVDDERMRRLNREFRKINRTTDVLSFPQYKFLNGDLLEPVLFVKEKLPLGDIVISLETIERRSRCKRDFEGYLLKAVIHGILHLLGFDHKSDKDRKVMRGKEGLLYKIYRRGFSI